VDLEVDTSVTALKMEASCFSKTLVSPTSPQSVTTQKTNIDIFTAVRTSNLANARMASLRDEPGI
jgi:hypothetical protein